MNYSKAANSSSVTRKSNRTGPPNRTNEQNNLLQFIRQGRGEHRPNKNDSQRIVKPPGYQPHISTQETGLSKRFEGLAIKEETIEDKRERVKKALEKTESPFIWSPKHIKPFHDSKDVVLFLQEKDKEIQDRKKFKWRNFIFQLVISYELYNCDKVTEALETLNGVEKIFQNPRIGGDYFFMGIEDALWHVINASKLFLYLKLDMINEACQIVEVIRPIGTMNRSNQAGIYGIRAAVFMEYGHKGNVCALEEAKKAVELDRACPEWHFIIAKCFGRIRRLTKCYDYVDPIEQKAINKAIELDKINPRYIVYQAQLIREKATTAKYKFGPARKDSEELKKRQKMAVAAHYKFIEASKLGSYCPHILMRCAYGMMKLPRVFVDLKLVRESIDKAIELAPNNPMAHHIKGLFYDRFYCDINTVMSELEKASSMGIFGAGMDIVRLHYKNKSKTIIEELEALANRFEEPSKVQVAYTQAGSYFLFVEHDLVQAVKYYLKVIDMDPDSYAMKFHKPIYLTLKYPINMFEVVLEELKTENTNWGSFPPEDRKVLKEFMIKARDHKQTDDSSKKLTVEEIVQISRKRIIKFDKDYRRSVKRPKRWTRKTKKDKKDKNTTNKQQDGSCTEGLGGTGHTKKKDQFRKETNHRDSSVSSVDSDYQRESTIAELKDCGSSLGSQFREKMCLSLQDMNSVSLKPSFVSESDRWQTGSTSSRDSSPCSTYSNEGQLSKDINHEKKQIAHDIHSQNHIATNSHKESKCSSLTVANLETFDSMNSSNITKKMAAMSISSAESGNRSHCSESLSVMDRVKESYRMLSYKSNDQQNKGKSRNVQKSDSSQNINLLTNRQDKVGNKKGFQRSGSTQSLNLPQGNSEVKPKFSAKNIKIEKCSFTFMPDYCKK